MDDRKMKETASKIIALCDKIDAYINAAVMARIKEEPILADAKGQATEAAILTACSEFKRFCDTMIDGGANSDKSVPEVFLEHKEYWIEAFECELRKKLQAYQPMQGQVQTK